MTFEAEWARIKQEVAVEKPVTRLASADDGGSGGGGGDVVSTPQAWRTAASGAEAVAGNAGKALATLLLQQEGLQGMKSAGVECVGAQSALYDSWNDYLSRVRSRTTALQGQFTKAGKAHHQGDGDAGSLIHNGEDIRLASGFGVIVDGDGYRDTPQLGGGADAWEA